MENIKPISSIKVNGGYPLRGNVHLSSSPTLTKFIISITYLLKCRYELKGDFHNSSIKDFVGNLKDSGYFIKMDSNSIYVDPNFSQTNISNIEFSSLESHFLVALYLESKGYAEIDNNEELVDFLSYLGFVSKKRSQGKYVVYNKITTPRTNLIFQELNVKYLLLAILFQLLNLKTFSITFPDESLEVGILLDLLQELTVLKEIDHSKNIQLTFEFPNIKTASYKQIDIPGDPIEFCFFSSLALFTKGEIKISGIKSSFLTSLLRLYSSIGGGYAANENSSLRVWFSGTTEIDYNLIECLEANDQNYFTIMLPGLSTAYQNAFTLLMNPFISKSLIQDINRLGGDILSQKDDVILKSGKKFKDGSLYFEGEIFADLSRLLLSLISEAEFDIYNVNMLDKYNFKILDKLEKLGSRITS